MQQLQKRLKKLLQIQEDYLNAARNNELLNNKIRALQKKIREFKK